MGSFETLMSSQSKYSAPSIKSIGSREVEVVSAVDVQQDKGNLFQHLQCWSMLDGVLDLWHSHQEDSDDYEDETE